MYLPIRLSDVHVLLLVSINLFVHSLALVLIFRKGQPNLLSCKVLSLFHNCYYYYCCILNFNTHSPLCFENNSMKILKSSTFVFVLVDQWIQLCFLRQVIIFHNIFGLAIHSLQWMIVLIM